MRVVDGAASAATGGWDTGAGAVSTTRAPLGVSRAEEQLAGATAVGARARAGRAGYLAFTHCSRQVQVTTQGRSPDDGYVLASNDDDCKDERSC